MHTLSATSHAGPPVPPPFNASLDTARNYYSGLCVSSSILTCFEIVRAFGRQFIFIVCVALFCVLVAWCLIKCMGSVQEKGDVFLLSFDFKGIVKWSIYKSLGPFSCTLSHKCYNSCPFG